MKLLIKDILSDLMSMVRIPKTIASRIVRYFFLRKNRFFSYGPFSLIFPFELYDFIKYMKKQYPRYDVFLGCVTSNLPAGSTVIDVGANCGDTLGEMFVGNQACTYLAIEPESTFMHYLKRNQARLQLAFPKAKIFVEQALVGKELKQAELVAYTPITRTTQPSDKGIKSRTLDSIVQGLALPPVSLLKVDVDGYDYDVIDSGWGIVEKDLPAIFFEYCFFNFSEQQKKAYEGIVNNLFALGYKDWAIFDGGGNLMVRLQHLETLIQLVNYPFRSGQKIVYFFDVFTVPEGKKAWMDSALASAKVL